MKVTGCNSKKKSFDAYFKALKKGCENIEESGDLFTTLYFLLIFQMGLVSQSVTLNYAKRLGGDKHSSFLEMFASYEENEVM